MRLSGPNTSHEERKVRDQILAGVVGAVVVNALHESARKFFPKAPHIDLVGMRGLGKVFHALNFQVKDLGTLRKITLGADLFSNAAYYSFSVPRKFDTSKKSKLFLRPILFGALAGFGAITLPEPLGIGQRETNRTPQTALMAFSWYFLGGVATAVVSGLLDRSRDDSSVGSS